MLNPQKLKSGFPILSRHIHGFPLAYLDNGATTQKPQIVIDALIDFYSKHNANIHRGLHTLSDESTQMYHDARQVVANFINAKFEEIIFTRNATESLNLLSFVLTSQIKTGDEILITQTEHHANLVPWQLLAAKTGAVLKFIPIDDKGYLEFSDKLINQKSKIISLPHISNVLGLTNPVTDIFQIAKKSNPQIITILDAAQSAPHIKLNVTKLHTDFLAFSGHKIYGPTGIGVLYGKKDLLDKFPPFLTGGDMIDTVSFKKTTFNKLPEKFEAGTPNIAGAIGLATAIKYITKIDLDKIHTYEKDLTTYLLQKLQTLKNIKIIGDTDPQNRSSLVSFTHSSIHAHDLAQVLDSVGVAVRSGHHCAMPLHNLLNINGSTRASLSFYNTKEDINRLILGLQKAEKIFQI
jgi:cysteine desulfurase / selenocysteine lyase